MDAYEDFCDSSWIGVPAVLYEKQRRVWDGRLKTRAAYFRREFTLDGEGARLTLCVSASTRYRLYVNGASLLSGPCKGDRFRHFYETLDVSRYLKPGGNVIAVKVVCYPPYDAIPDERGDGVGPQFVFGSAAGPCLIVGGGITDGGGRPGESVSTGGTPWTVCLDGATEWKTPSLSLWMGGMEVVDGAGLPGGWAETGVPGGDWALADIRWPVRPNGTGGIMPFPLLPRPIPPLYETPAEFRGEMPLRADDAEPFTFEGGPAVIPPYTRAAAELDAGELTTAYVSLPMTGGQGAEVIIRYAECYTGDSPTDKSDRADCVNRRLAGHEDVYRPYGGKDTYSPFWFRSFRFLRVEVQTAGAPLTVGKPALVETGYPLEVKTTFRSSDPALEKLWEISVRTQKRCLHETYEDCPYYEQLQYTMDTRLQMLFTYALSGDTRMALRTIGDFHASLLPEGILQSRYPCQVTQVIPVFALHWIFMLEDYYRQTGDASVPLRYRPTVDSVLGWFSRHTGETGLVGRTDYWQFTDWVEQWEDRYGVSYASTVGPSATTNLTYALALRAAARLNRLTGRNDAAAAYDAEAEAVLAGVQKYCWDEAAGLYREGPGVSEYGQHAQTLAVLAGLAKDDAALMAKTMEEPGLLKASFPWMFYIMRALEKAGMYGRASVFFDRLTDFVKLNATTVPERDYDVRSECHAWGAFPLYEFPRSLLGVRPAKPGWSRIEICPFFGIADSCSGTVATPAGGVEVAWEREGSEVRLWGGAPIGVPCEVVLPDGRRRILPDGGEFRELCKII
ncbi:MAG: hypothetical protein FWC55_00690 [Firmicutes bacterium]|nr:hypothetical protein [Bacillota bacterium]